LYQHIFEDDYLGLQAISSTENPLEQLRFLLSKDLPNLTSYLSVDGIFSSAQLLSLNLPFKMFDSSSLFLTQNAATINPNHFTFTFHPEGVNSGVPLTVTLTDNELTVETEIDQIGTIKVVKKTCDAGEILDDDGDCQSSSAAPAAFAITKPTLEYWVYHDQDASLRTFTWPAGYSDPECSLDGGTTWIACTTPTSLTLSVGQFNAYPTIAVKVIDNAGVELTETVDLNDSTEGMNNTFFRACDHVLNSSIAIGSFPAISPGLTICLTNGLTVTASGGSNTILVGSNAGVAIIGDHDNPAIFDNNNNHGNNDYNDGIKLDGTLPLDLIVAHLDIDIAASSTVNGIKYPNIAGADWLTSANLSFNYLVNVSINMPSMISMENLIYLGVGHYLKIQKSHFYSSVSTTSESAIKLNHAHLYMVDSSVTIDDGHVVTSNWSSQPAGAYYTKVENSVFQQGGCSGNSLSGFFGSNTSGAGVNIHFEGNHFKTGDRGVFLTNQFLGFIDNNLFEHINACPTSTTKAIVMSSSGNDVDGSGNQFCYKQANSQFPFSAYYDDGAGSFNSGSFQGSGPMQTTCPTWP